MALGKNTGVLTKLYPILAYGDLKHKREKQLSITISPYNHVENKNSSKASPTFINKTYLMLFVWKAILCNTLICFHILPTHLNGAVVISCSMWINAGHLDFLLSMDTIFFKVNTWKVLRSNGCMAINRNKEGLNLLEKKKTRNWAHAIISCVIVRSMILLQLPVNPTN